ncbi:L,D-transpeptidase family protein [Enterovibrio paralichthyis]|uniref:L,D-transpeptidase family protein n=1 Tax=Enterovibrio paralichthyis TaxID=2853805 RepID=UPI0006CFD0F7|nr:L,D-transpeptidase family protein [Enterovibrio paralichthyis]MBV7296301.1 L,D-transpeptidase family protein [Enterovibrio paralichthyis]
MIRLLALFCLLLPGFFGQALAFGHDIDLVKVDKSARKMYLIAGTKVIKRYDIALGANPKGHKLREGDKRTPEGRYTLDFINESSGFYRSIRINYPNAFDIARAARLGIDPGGQIMIHGQKNGEGPHPSIKRGKDWTDGCIAIDNQEMDEFLRLVKVGTPIDIEW